MERLKNRLKNNQRLRRFILVGLTATIIDFGILFALTSNDVPTLGANIFSTLVAFLFSFFANKHYTFQSHGGDQRREIIAFTVVTLTGLWALQSLVIVAVESPLQIIFSAPTALFLAKVLATIVSTTWNYLLYSRVVFAHKDSTIDVK